MPADLLNINRAHYVINLLVFKNWLKIMFSARLCLEEICFTDCFQAVTAIITKMGQLILTITFEIKLVL